MAGKSPANYQDEDRVLLVSPYSTQKNDPLNFQAMGFSPQSATERLVGRRTEMLKSGFPKILSTQSLSKEKSSRSLQIFPRKPLLCPPVEAELKGKKKKKKNALRESWGNDKERHKKKKKRDWGLRSSFGVPMVCGERFPQGPGLGLRSRRARNRSGSSLGMRAGQSPVSSAWLGAPAGM